MEAAWATLMAGRAEDAEGQEAAAPRPAKPAVAVESVAEAKEHQQQTVGVKRERREVVDLDLE